MTESTDTHSVDEHPLGSHRLGPHVVGQRVVVRHLLPDGRGTDVLGTCLSWTDSEVVIDRDQPGSGETGPVRIAVDTIVTGKPIPPRASVRHRVAARDVELHVASLWGGQESVPLGDWVLRTAPPHDGRLRRRGNSALAMDDPGVALAEASERVVAHYLEHDRPAIAQVQADSEVEAGLLGLGWRPLGSGSAHCQLASVARAVRACNRRLAELDDRSGAPTAGYEEEGNRLRVVLDAGARGRAAVDGDWLGLHSIEVDPRARGQRLGTAVVAELLDWGASLGATTAWLHVEVDNEPALEFYDGLGFVTHHTNHYLTKD